MKTKIFLLVITFSISLRAGLLPVPLVRQATPYSCGPAAFLSVMQYWKLEDLGELALHKLMKTTEASGTTPFEIEKVASKFGLQTILKQNTTLEDISAAIEKREPVIVDFQAWPDSPVSDFTNHWEDGHYAVVVGIDSDKIYFMDPSNPSGYAYLTRKDFLTRWHDVEDRDGKRLKTYQLALFFTGKTALDVYPAPLTEIE